MSQDERYQCHSVEVIKIIEVCNIKSIQQTKLKIMAKNLIFGTLDHSKMLPGDF